MPPTAEPDYRAIFEQGPTLLLLLDPSLNIAAASNSYLRATMTERSRIVGRNLFEVFPDNPDDPGATGMSNLRASLERVLHLRLPDAMAVQKYDIERPASEGGGFEERYWSPINTPILAADGAVAWILHRVQDVTELVRLNREGAERDALFRESQIMVERLRRANDELARTRTFLDLVIENIPAMLFVKKADDLSFVLLNGFGESLFGVRRGDVIGRTDHDFLPRDEADILAARDRGVIETGQALTVVEERMTAKYPEPRLLQTTKMPVFDDRGRPVYLLGLSEDITERRSIEAQLAQAQKMEAIGELTGGMAHDFNNLLGVIIGNLDLLRGRPGLATDDDEIVGEALDAALRGADLTRRLLAFARRQPLQPRRLPINDVVEGISRLLRRTLGETMELRLDLGGGVWPVIADPAQLESALVNIVTNARDAMPDGGLLMIATGNRRLDADYVAEHPGLAEGDYALIEVSDTGSGMPAEVAARIFEPFFSTKGPGKGSGLGLSMVFGFMKQSGGHINVYSEVGVGTTFRLYLPRTVAAGEAVAEAPPAPMERGGHETVLAVEDNPGLRKVVVRQLRELGYRVLEAEDGPRALRVLDAEPVDLVFSDVVMPGGITGYELARLAKLRRPEVRVVLTSGFPEAKLGNGHGNGNGNGHGGSAAAGDHGGAAGGHEGPPAGLRLLTKPYRREELARVIREALDA
ncbi:MAG TPA: PAS domain-containing protein [Bauldia sp.]|nr:PAS domain-containing protein [Bauldia sp.]